MMKFFIHQILFIIVVVVLKATNGGHPARIIGGASAKIEDYPFMVALYNGYTWGTCGAMIISTKHVLTAAHCIVEGRERNDPHMHELKYYNVLSGDGNYENEAKVKVHELLKVDIHKTFIGYPPPDVGDIAILTLKEPIEVGPTRRPVALPTRRYNSDYHGKILGWGWTEPDKSSATIHLKSSPMTLEGYTSDKKLVASEREGIAFCNGDSGGPLYVNKEVIGIISYSADCTGNTAGVYTDVYAYLDWIEKILGGEYNDESAKNIRIE